VAKKYSHFIPRALTCFFIGKTVGGALSQAFSNEPQKIWSVDKEVDKGVDRVGAPRICEIFQPAAHDLVIHTRRAVQAGLIKAGSFKNRNGAKLRWGANEEHFDALSAYSLPPFLDSTIDCTVHSGTGVRDAQCRNFITPISRTR
jgi:hypothetical protein